MAAKPITLSSTRLDRCMWTTDLIAASARSAYDHHGEAQPEGIARTAEAAAERLAAHPGMDSDSGSKVAIARADLPTYATKCQSDHLRKSPILLKRQPCRAHDDRRAMDEIG